MNILKKIKALQPTPSPNPSHRGRGIGIRTNKDNDTSTRRRLLILALTALITLLITAPPASPHFFYSESFPIPVETDAGEAVKTKLLETMEKYDIIGLNFLVIKKNTVAGYGCFGYADLERKVPMKKETIFRIASISKPIVAAAILQLVQKHRCRLDDDVSKYLKFRLRNPRYPKRPITLRQLLTHTSGLTDNGLYDQFLEASYGQSPPSLASILASRGIYASRRTWKPYPPGKHFSYSNLGYGIIATAVEKISRLRFDEYCRKHIFTPLNMNASFNVDDITDVENFAVLYSHYSDEERIREEYRNKPVFEPSMDQFRGIKPPPRDFRSLAPGYNAVIHSPQGGARSSMMDLAKFMGVCMNGGVLKGVRILSRDVTASMIKNHWEGWRQNGIYRVNGLGLHITRNLVRGVRLAGHSGRAYGFQGTMYFDPVKKNGIIILMNGGDFYRDENDPVEFHNVEKELYGTIYDALIR